MSQWGNFFTRILKENAIDRTGENLEKNFAHDIRTQCVKIIFEYGILLSIR